MLTASGHHKSLFVLQLLSNHLAGLPGVFVLFQTLLSQLLIGTHAPTVGAAGFAHRERVALAAGHVDGLFHVHGHQFRGVFGGLAQAQAAVFVSADGEHPAAVVQGHDVMHAQRDLLPAAGLVSDPRETCKQTFSILVWRLRFNRLVPSIKLQIIQSGKERSSQAQNSLRKPTWDRS